MALFLRRSPVNTDKYVTHTSREQTRIEETLAPFFGVYRSTIGANKTLRLLRDKTVPWLLASLQKLPASICYLDCSRTWILYWVLHALELLGWDLVEEEAKPGFSFPVTSAAIVKWISKCFTRCTDPVTGEVYGGYGGGPVQLPHLAPTYAAVCALCIIGTPEAYESIPKEELLRWLLRLKTPEGSLRMHEGGEVDVRAIYTCLAVATLCNLRTPELELGVADYLLRCQTFDGGMGSEPYDEAHGGYTFCGLASLLLLRSTARLDLPRLVRWV
eukprot:RCo027041